MQLEFEASAEPQPELGDIWHDSAEDADWLEGLCSEDGEGAAAPYAGASDDAAAAAFADASSIFHSLYPDGHLTDEAHTALAQQMGVSLSSGMHAYVSTAVGGWCTKHSQGCDSSLPHLTYVAWGWQADLTEGVAGSYYMLVRALCALL